MKILRTTDIPDDAIEAFKAELSEDFAVEVDSSLYEFKSVDPPSWIKLVGDLSWWQQGLMAYAALYVAEIVKESAKDSWRGRAKAISAVVAAGTKIKRLVGAIGQLGRKLKSKTEIVLFIPIPNEYFGTSLRLSKADAELSEIEIALFIYHLPQLSALITSHSSSDVHPSTGYFLKLRDDAGMEVLWYDSQTIQKHSVVLSLNAGKV
ncbi:hypothetical protein [Pseudomonas sp. S2_A02]